ncbi:HAUS augmin-like complex subunit 4 [Morphnus guianensis]
MRSSPLSPLPPPCRLLDAELLPPPPSHWAAARPEGRGSAGRAPLTASGVAGGAAMALAVGLPGSDLLPTGGPPPAPRRGHPPGAAHPPRPGRPAAGAGLRPGGRRAEPPPGEGAAAGGGGAGPAARGLAALGEPLAGAAGAAARPPRRGAPRSPGAGAGPGPGRAAPRPPCLRPAAAPPQGSHPSPSPAAARAGAPFGREGGRTFQLPQGAPPGPPGPQNPPRGVAEGLAAEHHRLRRARRRHRSLSQLLERQRRAYPQVLGRCRALLARLAGERFAGAQAELDRRRAEYLEAKGTAVLLKIRLEELNVLLDTYPPEKVEAHRRIRAALEAARERAAGEAAGARAALAAFGGLGPRFGALAGEYGRLRERLGHRRWALRQLRHHDP